MEDILIELLTDEFGYPVYRQGSLAEDAEYPDNFFTFWNTESLDHAHYDNAEYGISWNFDVNFYSDDPEETYRVSVEAIHLLKANGWIITGRGYDVLSDEPTHTGRGFEAFFLETTQKEGI